ncbi:Polyamine aminopropyltransferase (Putrescine aminopropyltransferase) (PAPT) (Spermidine synthase) (SPDS) (SPDSY), partial [Durusdinium trenchii]
MLKKYAVKTAAIGLTLVQDATVRGMLAGTAVVVAVSQYHQAFGFAADVWHALTFVCGLLVATTITLARDWVTPRAARITGGLLLASWLLVHPSLLDAGRHLCANVPVETLERSSASVFVYALAALLGPVPVVAATCLFAGAGGATGSRTATLRYLAGVAIAPLGLAPLLLGNWDGQTVAAMIVAAVSIMVGVEIWGVRAESSGCDTHGEAGSSPLRERTLAGYAGFVRSSVLAGMTGVSIAIGMHVVRELIPQSFLTEFVPWSGVLLGIAVGAAFARRVIQRGPAIGISGTLLATATLFMVVGFAWWSGCAMWINAYVTSTWGIVLCRSLLVTALLAPCGAVLGVMIAPPTSNGNSMEAPATSALWLTVGMALAGLSEWSPVWLAQTVVVVAVLIALLDAWRMTRFAGLSVSSSLIAGTGLVVVAASPLVLPGYLPGKTEVARFSTDAYVALRAGTDRDWLTHLSDERLVAEAEDVNTRWSVWRQRGCQTVIRRDGIVYGMSSTDPTLCPQSSAEVLPVLLSLVLHPQAERALICWESSPAALATGLSFPVRKLVAMCPDARLVELLRQEDPVTDTMFSDSRLELRELDAVRALSGKHLQTYDVIVTTNGQTGVGDATACLTREFYANASRHLAGNGIFCQRVTYSDIGPEPLRRILAGLRAEFPQAIVLEASPGELLMVAAKHERPLIDTSVIDRMQAPHVRQLVAQLGWDWAVIMSLGALDDEATVAFVGPEARPHTVSNIGLAFRLPLEVLSWGNKWQASRQALAAHGSAMGSWLGNVPEAHEIEERLADVRMMHDVFRQYPDQLFAYRARLKERLQDRPRSRVVQVKGEGLTNGMHPEDRRRKDYLKTLGKVATSSTPETEEIEQLNDFLEPYDPLVSYFVHVESAALH